MDGNRLDEILQKHWDQMLAAAAFLMHVGSNRNQMQEHKRRLKELEDSHKDTNADLSQVKQQVGEIHGYVKAMYEKSK